MNTPEAVFEFSFIPESEAKTVCIQQDDKSITLTETQARELVKDINFFIKEQNAENLILEVLDVFNKYIEVLKRELSNNIIDDSTLSEISKGIQILSGILTG